MNRTGLLAAIAVAAVTGLVFGIWPQFDVAISRWFYEPGEGFPINASTFWNQVRDGSMIAVAAIVGVPIGALIAKLIRPAIRMPVPGRAVAFLLATIVLAPLLMANVVFKDNWARPRPRDVAAFSGPEQFRPWWDPRGGCPDNCSFVAGEAAGAFWTLAPAAIAPPQWRPLAYGAAIVFGAATGALRMAFGGHFFSDVVFAGVFTFLIVWFVHGLLYRWRIRIRDATVEDAIGRIGMGLRKPFGRKDATPTQASNRDAAPKEQR